MSNDKNTGAAVLIDKPKTKKSIFVLNQKVHHGELMDEKMIEQKRGKQEMKKFNAQEKFEVENTKGWVDWGQDNLRPQYLGFLYKSSGLHRAIVDGFSQMAAGLGCSVDKIDAILAQAFRQFAIYGIAPIEVIYSGDGKEIAELNVLSMANIRFSWDKDLFEVNGAYYSRDWTQPTSKRGKVNKLCLFDRIKRFGTDENGEPVLVEPKQVAFIMLPAEDGRYYPDPSYQGGIDAIEIDRLAAEFHRNSLENGLFPSMMITVKGVTEVAEQDEIQRSLQDQLSGASNTGKFVLNFTDIDGGFEFTPITTNEADKLYQWQADYATEKILQAHGVVSPLLFGIRTATGFGGNAEEMKTGEYLYTERVIKPAQKLFEDYFSKIFLQEIKITPRPSMFAQETTPAANQVAEKKKFNEALLTEFIELNSEQAAEDWICIDEYEADTDNDDADLFVSTGTARPNAKSSLDKTIDGVTFYARFEYAGNENPERPFCKKMMQAGKIYRKEDIMAMGSVAVNAGWGPRGVDTYSIWLYKGGGACKHFWKKKIYVSAKDLGIDINSPNAKTIAAEKAASKGFRPRIQRLVQVKPTDMPNKGFLPKD
jgi:hypothetical protein